MPFSIKLVKRYEPEEDVWFSRFEKVIDLQKCIEVHMRLLETAVNHINEKTHSCCRDNVRVYQERLNKCGVITKVIEEDVYRENG